MEKKSKLELSKDTLLSLDDQDLAGAIGGLAADSLICASKGCHSNICSAILGGCHG